jgi:hypothetical protein
LFFSCALTFAISGELASTSPASPTAPAPLARAEPTEAPAALANYQKKYVPTFAFFPDACHRHTTSNAVSHFDKQNFTNFREYKKIG